jgi:hypothetical protein
MNEYIAPIAGLTLASVVFWFKANAKMRFGLDWSPFTWWWTTSLLTNYLTLHAWWRLIALSDVWRAGVLWGLVGLIVDLVLNTYFFGVSWRGAIALALCALAAFISAE